MVDASVSRAPKSRSVRWVWWVAAIALISAPFVLNTIVPSDRGSLAPQAERELAPPPPPGPSAESEYRKTPPPPKHETAQEHGALPKPETPKAPKPAPSKPKVAAIAPVATGRSETGRASWYALPSATASGETMDGDDLTAAHPSLPFGTKVLVENLDNGRSVVVRINDRGPFTGNRIIDLSKPAAEKLDMIAHGIANVRVSRVSELVSGAPTAR